MGHPLTTALISGDATDRGSWQPGPASRRCDAGLGAPQTPAPAATPIPARPAADLALRHLRHHTNNTLQRLLADLAGSELQGSEAGRRLIEAMHDRIMASAAVANALFAVTAAPAPLEGRLRALCDALRRLHAGPGQMLTIQVSASLSLQGPGRAIGAPEDPVEVMVHVVRELVENALRHGLHARSHGQVRVRVTDVGECCVLSVADDGWGLGDMATGPGLALVRDLVTPLGGQVSFGRREGWTVVRVVFDVTGTDHGR